MCTLVILLLYVCAELTVIRANKKVNKIMRIYRYFKCRQTQTFVYFNIKIVNLFMIYIAQMFRILSST